MVELHIARELADHLDTLLPMLPGRITARRTDSTHTVIYDADIPSAPPGAARMNPVFTRTDGIPRLDRIDWYQADGTLIPEEG
mgnify:CR=1 FL=1